MLRRLLRPPRQRPYNWPVMLFVAAFRGSPLFRIRIPLAVVAGSHLVVTASVVAVSATLLRSSADHYADCTWSKLVFAAKPSAVSPPVVDSRPCGA